MFVCFTGIDGSGKTTMARLLVNLLSKRGYSCMYVRAAHRPVFSYVFYGVTRSLGFWKDHEEGRFTDPLELAPRNIRIAINTVWLFFLYLDFQMIALIKVRIPLIFGKVVVCDRYAYDMITELLLLRQYSRTFGKLVLRTIPQPNITFLMDLPEETANARHGNPIDFLSARRKVYLKLAYSMKFFVLDTTSNPETTKEQVWNYLSQLLKMP